MKYPRFNGKQLDGIGKKFFRTWYGQFRKSIELDNRENRLGLTRADISLLAHNCATVLTSSKATAGGKP